MEYNRLLAYRETKRNWEIHEQKIKSIKPTINTRTSATASKPKNSFRKFGQLNRILDVQFQNKALLKKLTQCKAKQGGCGSSRPLKASKTKNVHDQSRQIENRGLLKRIQNSKASYKTNDYLKQYKQNEKYANILCKYSYKGQKPTKTLINMDMTNDIDKYVDIKKNSHVVVSDKSSKEKLRKLNRIVRIHTQQPMKIDNEDFSLKLVEMEDNIIIEITKERTSFCLELEREAFQKSYEGSVDRLMKGIKYNKKMEEIYLA